MARTKKHRLNKTRKAKRAQEASGPEKAAQTVQDKYEFKLRKGVNAYIGVLYRRVKMAGCPKLEVESVSESSEERVCTVMTPEGEQLRAEGASMVAALEAMLR